MTAGDASWLGNLGTLALVGLLPFLVIAGTSFAKIAVVLAMMRSALGAPSVLPASVATALAAVLSVGIMAPVASRMAEAAEKASKPAGSGSDALGIADARRVYDAVSPPLLEFLERNTPDSELDFFEGLLDARGGEARSIRVLLPAFALGEMIEAFLIGFLLLVPFLVVDLIVANTLLVLGTTAMSPATVALPLKLLLFLAVDGWHILVSGLAVSYGF